MDKYELAWSKKTKTYKIKYFAALGELFNTEKANGLEAVPESKAEKSKSVLQEG